METDPESDWHSSDGKESDLNTISNCLQIRHRTLGIIIFITLKITTSTCKSLINVVLDLVITDGPPLSS